MKELYGKMVYETLEEITDPKHTVLLVIDIQNDNASSNGFLAKNGRDISWAREMIPRVKRVLEEAHRIGVRVIYSRNTNSRGTLAESPAQLRHLGKASHVKGQLEYEAEGTWGNEVLDELEPRPDEVQIVKYRSSAFHGTRLDFILKNTGVQSVVVIGLVTEGCVESTVRDILGYGYYPVIVRDCVTSSRRDLHDAALMVMCARYDNLTCDELLQIWGKAR